MIEAYCRLHELGFAHSIECWQGADLAGGLYGIVLGRVFFGESMFSDRTEWIENRPVCTGSDMPARRGIQMIDCQMRTEHLVRFGARELARKDFQEMLERLAYPLAPQKKWRLQ